MTIESLKQHIYQQLSMFHHSERQSFFRMLGQSYLGLNAVDLVLKNNMEVSEENQKKIDHAVKRLQTHEPIQYILGSTYFYGLEFEVNPSVLIPRPETEELVSWILDHYSESDTPTILDLGTGSGCIAVTLAKHLPKANIFALDISSSALEIAQRNATFNNVKITCIEGDMLQKINTIPKLDIIVSNPPYVCQREKELMAPNVLKYEPHSALFVKDQSPLQFYEAIKTSALSYLNSGGYLFLEINEAFGEAMLQLFDTNMFHNTQLKKDTFGKDRMLKTQKK